MSVSVQAGQPTIINKPAVLAPHRVEVRCEGELVVIRIGNTDLKIGYEGALKLSQWIRVRAKEAKRRAGDISQHWSAIALLDDKPN